jgi:phosphoenolpyruvate carboxykinase (ATP)
VDCWLVNTGWTGGAFGVGKRMSIRHTRALLRHALDGSLARGAFRTDPFFGFAVPEHVAGVPAEVLDPRRTWEDKVAYDRTAHALLARFEANFAAFEAGVGADVRAVALRAAA